MCHTLAKHLFKPTDIQNLFQERIRMLRGRGVGLASWVILITSLGRILHLGGALKDVCQMTYWCIGETAAFLRINKNGWCLTGSIENPVPSFSFLCPAGWDVRIVDLIWQRS